MKGQGKLDFFSKVEKVVSKVNYKKIHFLCK